MANEELIYRITRAVYERLGAEVDEATIENLVADIYRLVEPSLAPNGDGAARAGAHAERQGGAGDARDSANRLVVSVFGVDRPGIVAAVSQILAESECSIIDINQTVVGGKFAMVLIADTTQAKQSAAELKERFQREGDRLGVRIYAQREDLFNQMHRI